MRLRHAAAALVLIGAVSLAAAARWVAVEAQAPGPLAVEKLVYIPPATPVRAIAALLLEQGVIRSDAVFTLAARWSQREAELKAGEYAFPPAASIMDVIAVLQGGKTHQRQITIPEGLTTAEIIALLNNEPALTGTAAVSVPEGSLLPETYNFSYGDKRQEFVTRMETAMRDELTRLWGTRGEDFPLSREEVVVLASIVEKETGIASERPRIAGVFMNRLKKGIPLQSDPTVIYALTMGLQKLDRALTFADLKKPSPYNTYLASGLPPTPIANPGRASLEAVLIPEKNDYLYFVADGTGGHVFSKTLAEHNRNVARWRIIQKKQANQ